MKKTNRLLSGSLLLAATLLFASCQKEADQVPVNTTAEISNQAVITKVNSWLEKWKVDADDDGDMKIEALKANLDFSALHLEKYKQNDKLVIVPLKIPGNYLVAILPESEEITKGNIVQYVSAAGKKPVPRNTFSKIFNYEDLDCNGQFTILSLTDDFRYELKFEDNKLMSVAERRSKSEPDNQKTNGCIDWFLFTTVYYTDGTSETFENYLYSTCGDDCNTTRIAGGRSFRISCGGGGGDVDYEYAVAREITWEVAFHPSSGGTVFSEERLKGKRVATEVYGGHFTDGCFHRTSSCVGCSSNNPYDLYYETFGYVSASKFIAASTVEGKIQSQGEVTLVRNNKSWRFNEVF